MQKTVVQRVPNEYEPVEFEPKGSFLKACQELTGSGC